MSDPVSECQPGSAQCWDLVRLSKSSGSDSSDSSDRASSNGEDGVASSFYHSGISSSLGELRRRGTASSESAQGELVDWPGASAGDVDSPAGAPVMRVSIASEGGLTTGPASGVPDGAAKDDGASDDDAISDLAWYFMSEDAVAADKPAALAEGERAAGAGVAEQPAACKRIMHGGQRCIRAARRLPRALVLLLPLLVCALAFRAHERAQADLVAALEATLTAAEQDVRLAKREVRVLRADMKAKDETIRVTQLQAAEMRATVAKCDLQLASAHGRIRDFQLREKEDFDNELELGCRKRLAAKLPKFVCDFF